MSEEQLSIFNSDSQSSQEFFTRKRSWSASKHRIILRYIQSCCYNLGGDKNFQSPCINYVDGFAGEGKYDEGFGIEDFVGESNFWKRYDVEMLDTDGSPLIALKCARAFLEEGRVILRCLLAEQNKETNQKLRTNCEALGSGLEYKVYEPQSFSESLPQIMNELHGFPTVFFLDSFGVKGLTFEQICQIGDYASIHKGELFLLFHNIAVARHAGYLTQKSSSEKSIKAAETYMRNLTTLLGPNSDQAWKPKWLELKDRSQQFERWALDYFVSRVAKESRFKGVASFEIKEHYNDTRPQYSIIVCSNHPNKAFGHFLNEFFADENKLLFYEEDKSKQNIKFLEREWTRQVEQRKVEIKPKIVQILNENNRQWKVLDDLITEIILILGTQGYGLGYLKRSDYRIVLIDLFRQGVIEAESLGKKGGLTLRNRVRIMQ